ncbi:peroxiredoxin family protein [Mucilaginibacter lacusdianchii]|uniref:peroxiredoxin family protein n=1 Tax=Mucilaginibacter lacusdianchii TaxID=2684211 RepID=UPI00131AACBE|nr:TlpA disulfide reductase family protein [Mucilaginibacter sp. JXJ CY 39]
MKSIFRSAVIALTFSAITNVAQAQNNIVSAKKVYKLSKLNEHSIVKDSSGNRCNYTAWNNMLASGRYGLKVAESANDKPSLIIVKLSKTEREDALAKLPKPAESPFFKTGELLKRFKVQDVNSQIFDSKELVGKVVVLNFWHLNHLPSMMDINNLNELADVYKDDPNVVFLAIPADNPDEVKEFLAHTTFKYHIIDKGKSIISKYNIETYPTSVVVDRNGKVQYHSSGYTPNTSYWITKTIEQCKRYNENAAL